MSAMEQHKENMALNAQIDDSVDALLGQAETMDQNAGDIGNEISSQIDMAKDINNHMDQTDANINTATNQLKTVQKVSKGGCASWIICLIFFVFVVLPPSVLNNFRSAKRAAKGW